MTTSSSDKDVFADQEDIIHFLQLVKMKVGVTAEESNKAGSVPGPGKSCSDYVHGLPYGLRAKLIYAADSIMALQCVMSPSDDLLPSEGPEKLDRLLNLLSEATHLHM